MTLPLNCLPEGETLVDLARRECAIGFELRFCRSVAVSPGETATLRQKCNSKPMAHSRRARSARVSPSGRQLRGSVMAGAFLRGWE